MVETKCAYGLNKVSTQYSIGTYIVLWDNVKIICNAKITAMLYNFCYTTHRTNAMCGMIFLVLKYCIFPVEHIKT
jgi:hypothetical protein